MSKISFSIDKGFYESETPPMVFQSCTNLYPKHPETLDASTKGALYRTPGLSQLNTVDGVGRGILKDTFNNVLYIVAGNILYKKTDVNTIVTIGTIVGSGRVSMAWNGITLCIIVPGSKGYFYTNAGGLTEITDATFVDFMTNSNGGVTSVCYKDSRFIYTTDDEFFVGSTTTVNNGQDFDALDYDDAEVKPDPIVKAESIKNELYIFGTETIEVYQVTTGSGFPYVRIPGATIEKGLLARFSLVPFDNSFVFVGASSNEPPAIWRGEPGSASKISNSAIDAILDTYSDSEIASITAWTYSDGGSWFAGFNLPDRTLVYDATASMIQQRSVWHERLTNNTKHRVEDVANMFGKNIVIDNIDGKVGYMSRDITTEYNQAVTRSFSTGYLHDNGYSFRISELEIRATVGVGNTSGSTDDDPLVTLYISTDQGNTYNSLGSRKIGRSGEYYKRMIWRRLGRIPSQVMFKVETDDTVPVDFYSMAININGNARRQ